MAKTVVKELIIILLLCLAIILVLGILLYEYVPMSKTIPNPVSYTTPQEVKQELLTAGNVDESQIVMTYSVDSNDLNNYKRIQDYKPGKANPFSSYEEQTSGQNTTTNNSSSGGTTANSGNTTTNNGSTNGGSTNQATGNTNSQGGGQFFQDKGTK